MKLTQIGPDEIYHRYLTPKWAFLPTSGAGARQLTAVVSIGRVSRHSICLTRHKQLSKNTNRAPASRRRRPLPPTRSRSPMSPTCRKDSTRTSGTAPGKNGIVLGARSLASTRKFRHPGNSRIWSSSQGRAGMLFPSLRHAGGTNLVIFPANLVDGDKVAVHDPDQRLPHDQSSWS